MTEAQMINWIFKRADNYITIGYNYQFALLSANADLNEYMSINGLRIAM